jgi:hypothetical protein
MYQLDNLYHMRAPLRQRRKRIRRVANLFHLLGYDFLAYTGAAADVNAAMTTVPDPSFTTAAGGGFLMTEQYEVLAAAGLGKSVSEIRSNMPSVNPFGLHNVMPLSIAAAVAPVWPNPAPIQDLRSSPLPLPTSEPINWQITNTAGATEHEELVLWIAPTGGWSRQIPAGRRITMKFTATPTITVGAWSPFVALTAEQLPMGGYVAVIGAQAVFSHGIAFQINFPRMPLVNGRKFYPGDLCASAQGQFNWPMDRTWLGPWGAFHTFELPTISVWGSTAGANAGTLWLDTVWLGNSFPGDLMSGSGIKVGGLGPNTVY